MKNSNFDEKGVIDILLGHFKRILKLGQFTQVINSALEEQYSTAITKLDNQLKLGINLVSKEKDLRFLQNYANQNIEGAADAISANLRQEIQRSILNGDTKKELITRVKKLFRDKSYKTRLKTIIRTETLRANNMGTFEGAKQAQSTGLVLMKWLDVTMDNRTSHICKKEHSKYGQVDKAIPLDENFIVKVDNKTYDISYPPAHPNCRSVLRIVEAKK